jgi:MFS family permease
MWKMIADADGPARRTLLGAALIKFATGLAVIWGTINIYFFSALKHQGAKIDQSTSSIVLLIALIPSSFAMLAANPFSRLVGYKFAVRIAALLFILSPMVLNYAFNMETFAVFWLVIPLIAFCLESIPVLNCLWTQFPRDLNKVSGIAILFFSLGMIFWNFVFLFIVNPHNIQAEIDANGLPIFPK